jgi:hypothetical protein
MASAPSPESIIRDVWADTLADEMVILRDLVERYPYISMVSFLLS